MFWKRVVLYSEDLALEVKQKTKPGFCYFSY